MPPIDFAPDVDISVSEFVALHNQLLDVALPVVTIVGELANYRVSKNKWVYFDLKDEQSSVKFFGTVFQLNGPLEDGMLLRVVGTPRVHPQFGFSITVQALQPAGEGSLKKAFDLLQAKLTKEGLFDAARKRPLPYPPEKIGLITSKESAAYADFIKIVSARWGGIEVILGDVQVQGEAAPAQITEAISAFNRLAEPPDVLVLTRGGGSSDDLWAFSTEPVTRAVAASRIPTLVAIGHEIDVSLAELAADQRASTPSNAAELLTPDREQVKSHLRSANAALSKAIEHAVRLSRQNIQQFRRELLRQTEHAIVGQRQWLSSREQMLQILDPGSVLRRGYAIIRDVSTGAIVRSSSSLESEQQITVQFSDGSAKARVE